MTGLCDLALKRVSIGGHANLIIAVVLNHEFGGNRMADVSRNGALRDLRSEPARFLALNTRIGE